MNSAADSMSLAKASSLRVSSINESLQDLNARHAAGFDPVRFAFIQGLANRLEHSVHANNRVLIEKTETSLRAYTDTLADHRRRAQKTLKKVIVGFPDDANAAQALFEQCQFRQLEELRTRLSGKQSRNQSVAGLSDLSILMNARAQGNRAEPRSDSFEDRLYQLEEQARLASNGAETVDDVENYRELKSVKVFRQSIRHYKIDKIIARAISVSPENPGPYNSHMLAIKAMTRMQDLSPQYLRRLSGYIETLLWLEKNMTKVDDSKSFPKGAK